MSLEKTSVAKHQTSLVKLQMMLHFKKTRLFKTSFQDGARWFGFHIKNILIKTKGAGKT
jgi:hypothetical protein